MLVPRAAACPVLTEREREAKKSEGARWEGKQKPKTEVRAASSPSARALNNNLANKDDVYIAWLVAFVIQKWLLSYRGTS